MLRYRDISGVWLLASRRSRQPPEDWIPTSRAGRQLTRGPLMTSIRRPLAACMGGAFVAGTVGVLFTTAAASADPSAVVDPDASVAYQHDPAHDGNSLDTSFVAPFTKAWSTSLGGTVGFPLIADG